MKVLILKGSPRKNGNTASLVAPFTVRLEEAGCSVKQIDLYDLDLRPCIACRHCQEDWSEFHCWQKDDMQMVYDEFQASDLVVLATPIYVWYCTPPMKSVLDRLTYGMDKYYGEEKGPALGAGKKIALITTCGYPPEKGCDLWETGVKRWCRHSQLELVGSMVERHMGYKTVFMDDEKAAHARAFADELFKNCGGQL